MSKGIKMKQLFELLRLHFELKFSQRDIAKMINISKTTVHNYIELFEASDLSWPLSEEYLDECKLMAKLNKSPIIKDGDNNGGGDSGSGNVNIDFTEVHHELKSHKHVTLKLLWEDLKLSGQIDWNYQYFTIKYNKWLGHQPSSMRQSHKGGEKVFVDYSGDKVPIYDAQDLTLTKILFHAEIFVRVLGASNYIYLDATQSQKICDFTMSHVRMFNHFKGTPELVIIDNLKSGVKIPSRYDPVITPAYYKMLNHYGVACMPARVYKPKDKPKAENGVLIIQRWILARLRKSKFTCLFDLNQELKKLMDIANNKKLQRYPYSRNELFNKIDKPCLKELPQNSYIHREYKKVRAGGDYHVELQGHYYSVPYNLVKVEIDLWYTSNLIECYYNGKCVATHVRSYVKMGKTTNIDHMPINHKAYAEMDTDKLKQSAREIGIATELIVDNILQTALHEAIALKRISGFLKLANKYGNKQLEEMCNYAINIGVYDYKNIQILLERKISPVLQHSNIRGSSYYCEG
jgi:transposase